MTFMQFLRRVIGVPVYSLFFKRIPFLFFYKSGSKWMMYTRGVSIPIKEPKLSAVEYYRHFMPKKGGIVFDVGGERGLEARQLSKIVGPSGSVYTFECMPDHVRTLTELAEQLQNVTVIDSACWNEKTELTLFAGNTEGSNTAIQDARGQHDQSLAREHGEQIVVKANTLDSLWKDYANRSRVDFLKMDIEGAEYEALDGAEEMLRATNYAVIAAYHIRDGQPTADRVASKLRDFGFEVRVDENYHVYGTREIGGL